MSESNGLSSRVKIPSFRLTRVFSIGDKDFDAAFINELVTKRGFRCDPVVASTATPSPAKVKRKIRRRKQRIALTAERIREFRKAREQGKSYRRIGAIFGVSEGRAWQIVNQGR